MWRIWKPILRTPLRYALFPHARPCRLEDCHVTALAAQAQSLHFNSGTVRNLYLNLDEIADWDVNTGSFHIDTEHLSGSRYHRCLLQKNECRRVFWTPLKDDASLSVELKQAVKIEVGE